MVHKTAAFIISYNAHTRTLHLTLNNAQQLEYDICGVLEFAAQLYLLSQNEESCVNNRC